MTYYLQIKDKKSYEWLVGLIQKVETTIEQNPAKYIDLVEIVPDLIQSLDDAKTNRKDLIEATPPDPTPKKKIKRRPKGSVQKPNLCPDHPTYGGQRVPRKDCNHCWKAYKKLHPMEYDAKRRAFRNKQRRKSKKK